MSPMFTIARNARTSFYEVHTTGCRHLRTFPHIEVMAHGYEGRPVEIAAQYEQDNEGCLAVLAPCARDFQ